MEKNFDYYVKKAHIQALNSMDDHNALIQACAVAAQETLEDEKWEHIKQGVQERYQLDMKDIISEPLLLTRIDKKLLLLYKTFDQFLDFYQHNQAEQAYREYCYIDVLAESLINDAYNIPESADANPESPEIQNYDSLFNDNTMDNCIKIFRERFYNQPLGSMNNLELHYYLCNLYYLLGAGFFILNNSDD